MTHTTSQDTDRPADAHALATCSIQARASLWALASVLAVCAAYELTGGSRSWVWSNSTFLGNTENFVLSLPPAIYATVYCIFVSISSSSEGLRRYAYTTAAAILPSVLFLPIGLAPMGDGPLIFSLSVSVAFFVAVGLPSLQGAIGMLGIIMGMVSGLAAASAMTVVPFALSERNHPALRRVQIWRHLLGIFVTGGLTACLYMIAVNVNVRGSILLGPLCFIPHVLAVGGLMEALRLSRKPGQNSEASA